MSNIDSGIRRLCVSFLFGALASANISAQVSPSLTLKEAYRGLFRVGVALNAAQFEERDPRSDAVIEAQFNSISPENALKWEALHPAPNRYDFDSADRYVSFGQGYGMFVVGHCLIWHSQTPPWVFKDSEGHALTREALLDRMRDHIHTVVGRYKGRIGGWDVVNEALNDDGSLRKSPWLQIIGDEYIVRAFQFAHEADPQAELYYNDYSLENNAKRGGALKLIRRLQAAGIPVSGVGLQGHVRIDGPSSQKEAQTIEDFSALGIQVNISELDVDVLPRTTKIDSADVSAIAAGKADSNPYVAGLPEAIQQSLARRYRDLFEVFVAHHESMGRVTLWGLEDRDSWLNNFPTRGRTNYPLLFDRDGRPKPALSAVVQVGAEFPDQQRKHTQSSSIRQTSAHGIKAGQP